MPPSLTDLIGQASRLNVGFLLEPIPDKPGSWLFYLGKTIKTGPGSAEKTVAEALKAAEKKKPEKGIPEAVLRASIDDARRRAGLPPHNWNAPRFVAPPPPPPKPKIRPPVPIPVKAKPKVNPKQEKKKQVLEQWNLF